MRSLFWARMTTLRRFRREEAGGATVEACIWLPVLLVFTIMVLDATSVFSQHARVHRIVQDGARQFVMGTYGTDTNALKTALEATMTANVSPNAVANVTLAGGRLTATITYPSADTDLSGATGLIAGLNMRAQAVYLME